MWYSVTVPDDSTEPQAFDTPCDWSSEANDTNSYWLRTLLIIDANIYLYVFTQEEDT